MTTPDDPAGSNPYDPPAPGSVPPPPSGPPYGAPPPTWGGQPAPPYGGPQYGAPQYGGPQYGAPQYWGPQPPPGGYAPWLRRVGGYLLDSLLLLPFFVIAAVAAGAGGTGPAVVAVAIYLGGFAFAIWNQIVRQGRTGRSLGKEWVGIRLIRERDGQPLGAGMNFVRLIAHFLDSLACYIGWLWPLWDDKRQTFADKVCGSIVVNG